MYTNCQIEMRVERTILRDGFWGKAVLDSVVVEYNEEEEYFILNTAPEDTRLYSLDNIYQCRIFLEEGDLYFYGMVKERFWDQRGGIIKVSIQNGFYQSL